MLTKIWIKNLALIEELELELKPGFTALTGETGSGKSIFLLAIDLLMGERADLSTIGQNGDKAHAEALFILREAHLENWFAQHDLDYSEELIIRREINLNGRSRAFVNDTPVNLNELKALTSQLLYVHSQYDTLELKRKGYALDLLDVLAENDSEKSSYWKARNRYLTLSKEQVALSDAVNAALQEKDYLTFQLEELRTVERGGESIDGLKESYESLQHVDEILALYAELKAALEDEYGLINGIQRVNNKLAKTNDILPSKLDWVERLKSVEVELKDIAIAVEDEGQKLERNPEKLLQLENFFNEFNRILNKHRVQNEAELNELKKNWEQRLEVAVEGEERLIELEKQVKEAEATMIELARVLHLKRVTNAPKIANEIAQVARQLKLEDLELSFELTESDQYYASGSSEATLLVKMNQGHGWKPVEKSASGGELSRLMLALQHEFSRKKQLPTLFFDEIDTGISGEVADKVGGLIKEMSTHTQMLAITHLPQVSSKAHHHIKVSKQNVGGVTQTYLTYLNDNQRVEEIARLMSGESVSSASLDSARILLQGS